MFSTRSGCLAAGSGAQGSGRKRTLGDVTSVNAYHVMSRSAGGEMLFGEVEKEAFVKILRRLERFAGVEVVTFCVMDNHFHLLTRVPTREKFLRRFEGLFAACHRSSPKDIENGSWVGSLHTETRRSATSHAEGTGGSELEGIVGGGGAECRLGFAVGGEVGEAVIDVLGIGSGFGGDLIGGFGAGC